MADEQKTAVVSATNHHNSPVARWNQLSPAKKGVLIAVVVVAALVAIGGIRASLSSSRGVTEAAVKRWAAQQFNSENIPYTSVTCSDSDTPGGRSVGWWECYAWTDYTPSNDAGAGSYAVCDQRMSVPGLNDPCWIRGAAGGFGSPFH